MSRVLVQGRLHPVTPLRRSWVQLSVFGWLAWGHRDTLDTVCDAVGTWAVVVLAAVLGAAVVTGYTVAWFKARYCLTREHLDYRYGLVRRVHRRFPIDKIRAVDVQRPLWARLIGVASLRIDTAGGPQSITVLSRKDAHRLRTEVLSLVHSTTAEDAEDAGDGGNGEGEGTVIARVSARDLAVSILLNARMMIRLTIGAGVSITPFLLSGHPLSLGLVLPWLRDLWHATGKRFPADHGWTVREVPGGYRTEHGLFNRSQYTWQHDRICSITLHQPVLWRSRNWVKITGGVVAHGRDGVILPVAKRHEAEKLMVGLLGADVLAVLDDPAIAPRRARRCTPFWRACAWSESTAFAAGWRGLFLRQQITVAPLRRVLTVHTSQGWWQRLHGVATVELALPGGTDVQAVHRATADAGRIADRMRVSAVKEIGRTGRPRATTPSSMSRPAPTSSPSTPANSASTITALEP